MQRVLLIDTNFSSGPIYKYLIYSGYQVYIIGGNSKDFLAKSLPNYINVDYTDLEILRKTIEELNIDYIVPGCNDRSYEVCAAINKNGIYPGIDSLAATIALNNKKIFRKFAMMNNIPVPFLLDYTDFSELVGRSIVVKPVDAFSGKGITVLHASTSEEIELAVDKAKDASREGDYLIEEFVDGQLYSHSAFILDGVVSVDFIVAEYGFVNPFVVDTSYVDNDFPQEIRKQICRHIQKIVSLLKLQDGLIHTQFIRKNNDFWFVEITRRCPGDLYSELIEISTGYHYSESYTKAFLGDVIINNDQYKQSINLIVRHTITQGAQCAFFGIEFHQLARLVKFVPLAVTGDQLEPSPLGRVGILFMQAESTSQRDEMVKLIFQRNLYSFETLRVGGSIEV